MGAVKRFLMESADYLSPDPLPDVVCVLTKDGQPTNAYTSRDTAEYEMYLCVQGDITTGNAHTYSVTEVSLSANTL